MRVSTDFAGGNGMGFETAGDHIRFRADSRGGTAAMWFHFRVENPGCDILRCEQIHDEAFLGPLAGDIVRPVYRVTGDSWKRVDGSAYDESAGIFSFSVPCHGNDVEIAFCYPYQIEDWHQFSQRVLTPAGGRTVPLGRSARGRTLFAGEVGDGPHTILLTARAHAGETPASYTLEGLVRRLCEVRARGLALRIIPFLDMDGVVEGMYSKLRSPVDFYMDWDNTMHPEITQYKSYIDQLPQPPVVAVDCHAPLAYHPHFLSHTVGSATPAEFRARMADMVHRLRRGCDGLPATRLSPDLTGEHPDWYVDLRFESSLPGFLQTKYGTLAVTLEAAYHCTHEGVVVEPDDWRALGSAVAEAIAEV